MGNRYLINDICDVGSSKRIYLSEYQNSGIAFYRGKEIIEKDSNREISNELFISHERYNEIKKKFGVPQKGDILMTAVGTIGISWYVNESNFYFKDGNLIWFKNFKKDRVNSKYLYYIFKSKQFSEIIKNISIGSTQKAITIEQVKKIELNFPKIEIQNKIVKILDNINNKIKINNELNNNLYQLTNELFEEKILNNQDKDNWKEYRLSDISKMINGYSYKGNELIQKSDIGMITIKNFERTGGFKPDGFKDIIPKKCKSDHYVRPFEVLVACTDLTQNADIIGNAIMLLNNSDYKEVIMSMDLVKLVPTTKLVDNYMLYAIVNSNNFKNFALGYKSGTTVLHLNKICFKEYTIKLPNEKLLKDLSKVIEINYKKISQIIEENKKLEQLKDALLPKLMNGEIDLDNVEI